MISLSQTCSKLSLKEKKYLVPGISEYQVILY